MWRNSLEASAIARSPCCLVVCPSLILCEKHEARSRLMVKDQPSDKPWARPIEDVG
jgi:hypothetical protein